MRSRSNARPDYSWEDEREDYTQGPEDEETSGGGVSGDRRVGARLPNEGSSGDSGTRQTHREYGSEEGFGSSEENQSAEEGNERAQEDESGYEALVSGRDPEIPYLPATLEQEDIPGYEGRRGELDA